MIPFELNRGGHRIWTEAHYAELRRLWPGHTIRECAAHMGVTKYAAHQAAKRAGLPAKEMPASLRKLAEGAKGPTGRAKREAPMKKFLLPIENAPRPRTCQWPTTDGRPWLFCGCEVVKGSYCGEHAEQAFAKPGSYVP